MSHLSPHSRSESERSQNQNATAIFVAVAGAILFAALWFANPSMLSWLIREKGKDDGTETTEVIVPENHDSDPASRVDWAAQIATIEQQLPGANPSERRKHLEPVLSIFDKEKLSEQEQASVRLLLNQLERYVVLLDERSSQSLDNLHPLDARLDSLTQSIRIDDDRILRTAIEKAQQRVRAEHAKQEPSIRDLRLSTKDNQDRAAALRRQIAQAQREQIEFKAKAARAEALRRDMADIKKYLTPFTAPGHLQPKVGSNAWTTERTVDPQPVSLARLQQTGALENTMEGLERLFIFGGNGTPADNLRPRNSFPEYLSPGLRDPEKLRAVKRAQQLLRDHGQALVEAQLLAP